MFIVVWFVDSIALRELNNFHDKLLREYFFFFQQPYTYLSRYIPINFCVRHSWNKTTKKWTFIYPVLWVHNIYNCITSNETFSPSCSQLESGWNIDLQELEYNPSKKDLTDARIHHLLAEELCKPYKRVSGQFVCYRGIHTRSVCRFCWTQWLLQHIRIIIYISRVCVCEKNQFLFFIYI